jgi:histidinol-phosphate aminotransferase
MDIEALMRPHIVELEVYEAPDWGELAAKAGTEPEALLRLDANENPHGPSPTVATALAQFEAFGYYPDYQALEKEVARYAGAERENIILTNGGDEAIDLTVRLFIGPGEGAIICPPAFSMYRIYAQAAGGRVLAVPRLNDFSVDVEGIEALVAGERKGTRPKMLFLTSPGNPDGLVIPQETIVRLLDLPLAVAVDEAYFEFGGESTVPLLQEYPNLIVLRTFSKWAGMAGLRLGYVVASREVAGAMVRLRPPYNVNAAAVVAALATFGDMDHILSTIAQLAAERDRLVAGLVELPSVAPIAGQTNFVFCRLEGRTGKELAGALADQGILVRSFSDPDLADALRITVGRPEQNDAVLAALAYVLQIPGAEPPAAADDGDTTKVTAGGMEDSAAAEAVTSRRGEVYRRTAETEVAVLLDLDGSGGYVTETGLGFLDHMLAQLAAHGLFNLAVRAQGDLEVDEHHTVEDVAIGLGQALDQALGDRRGLVRMGQAYAPLDEALAHVVVDLSGRPYAVIDVDFSTPSLGRVGSDLIIHFLETLATHARLSLHARVLHGRNDHHKAEALFKALGRALDAATRLDPRRGSIPSTKGVL